MSTTKAPIAAVARQDESEGLRVLQPGGWPMPKGYANGISAEGEVALSPELRLTGASGIAPRGTGFVGGAGKCTGRPTSMHVSIGVAGYTGKALIA